MNTTVSVAYEKSQSGLAPLSRSATACIAIVGFRDRGDRPLPMGLLDELNQARGVEDAKFSPTRARVVVVQYGHGTTQVGEVLRMVRQNGYEAVLVGC